MRTLLIISPNFPPSNTPDMQRVRMSLPYFAEFGWQPVVLAVDPAYVERVVEPRLLATIPSDIPIRRVRAWPVRWTRKLGVGDLGLRSLPYLYRAGAEMIKRYQADLVYFSTTAFTTMALGRAWKERFGVPYILDLQDPWVSDYYERKPKSERPPKYRLARLMHTALESWTMRKVDGLIAVSEAYHETLRRRYPWIPQEFCRTIPFGATNLDFALAAKLNGETHHFRKGAGLVHGVYMGALGQSKKQVCKAICLAFRQGLEQFPDLFSNVRLHFIGTDYAIDQRARTTIRPIAEEMGLGALIREDPHRVSHFDMLSWLREADFLLVPGSDNPQYTASKIYPYILANKPLLAIFHEKSSVVEVLRVTQAGDVVTFSSASDAMSIARSLTPQWAQLLERLPYQPATNWPAVEPYTGRELTRRQCELFDFVLQNS
jgi:hypothetical protein